jgi:hypothetical protein
VTEDDIDRMTAGTHIDYESLAQDAMRGIVRAVLMQTAKHGLPGEHHFYISFDTGAPGVSMSRRLKEKYPSEMTIVLQHRFWELIVSEERFEVKLTFDGIPERLVVPFAAIKVFFDPSVRYGLQFEEPGEPVAEAGQGQMAAGTLGDPLGEGAQGRQGQSNSRGAGAQRKPRAPRKSRADKEAVAPIAPAKPATAAAPPAEPRPIAAKPAAAKVVTEQLESAAAEPAPAAEGAKIVSLDSFRKK